MSFPDITIPPETNYIDLIDKLQRFFTSARKYWLNMPTNKTITNATDPGRPGQICYDSDYIYICIASDTWMRTGISTW